MGAETVIVHLKPSGATVHPRARSPGEHAVRPGDRRSAVDPMATPATCSPVRRPRNAAGLGAREPRLSPLVRALPDRTPSRQPPQRANHACGPESPQCLERPLTMKPISRKWTAGLVACPHRSPVAPWTTPATELTMYYPVAVGGPLTQDRRRASSSDFMDGEPRHRGRRHLRRQLQRRPHQGAGGAQERPARAALGDVLHRYLRADRAGRHRRVRRHRRDGRRREGLARSPSIRR